MGSRSSKNRPSPIAMDRQRKIDDEQDYQLSLRILEKYIKTNKDFKEELVRNDDEYALIDIMINLDFEKFNQRNKSKIKSGVYINCTGYFLCLDFYPKEINLSDPRLF